MSIKNKFSLLLFPLLLSLFLSLQVNASSKCSKVVMGGLDWDSSRFHEEVVKAILIHGYHCQVETIPGSTLPLLSSLGTGDIQILMEIWKDNFKDAWGKLEQAGKVKSVGVNFPDAIQGWFVPTYLVKGDQAQAPNLKHVHQLPQYKKLFTDPEMPNKGRFLNCILGWSCEDVNTKKLHAYGLNQHFTNFRPGTGAAMAAEIASKYKQREPFLTYYWGPTWILGKFDLTMLEEPPFDPAIWEKVVSEKLPNQATAYPMVPVHIGIHPGFAQTHPQVVSFLSQYKTTNKLVSEALSYIQDKKGRTPKDAALHFLATKQELWKQWVDSKTFANVIRGLKLEAQVKKRWKIDLSSGIDNTVHWLVTNYGKTFKRSGKPVLSLIIWVETLFSSIPWWLFTLLFGGLTYFFTRKKHLTGIVLFSFLFIWALDIWQLSIQTLALMVIATFISVLFGLPIGILISKYDRLRTITLPVLDTMQTMPSFVYLIPALMLFGLGKVPAVFATVIYSIVPIIRLTDLGIRSVDAKVVEAAESFGASYRQLLFEVKLPLALPSILAGINQTTMLALSMVVIASMIGARGLGEQVLLGIQKLNVGQGFTAGVGIVLLAIILDRMTQGLGNRMDKTR